jgi:hypothetical protein
MVLAVRSMFGKREGIATINEYDVASLQKACSPTTRQLTSIFQ